MLCFCVCSYPCPYLSGLVMRLVSFHSAGRQGLPPPAALFLPSWLLPLEAPASLSPPDSLALSALALRAKGWKALMLFCGCEEGVREWRCWAQHLTLWSCPFILRGTSSEEMELKVKASCFVLPNIQFPLSLFDVLFMSLLQK